MNYFSSNIKYLRAIRKASAADLAAACKVKEKEIKKIEKESSDISLELCLKLSNYFNIGIDALVNVNLEIKNKKAATIKMLVLDVDGVLTDGGMYYTESGDEFKKFNTKDGVGIRQLVKKGIKVAFLSNGKNINLIKSRAKLLGVEYVYVGLEEKQKILDGWMKSLKITYKNIAYMGDDINDYEVMKKAALSFCPADAIEKIKQTAHIITSRKGGDACVREVIDKYFIS